MAKINTAPSKRKKEDDEFYDYEAAKKAGHTKPDASGHWPSEFKKPGHPNLVVGGFNTKTGLRVLGTKQGTEKELRDSGWDAKSANRLTRNNTGVKSAKDVNMPVDTTPKKKKSTVAEDDAYNLRESRPGAAMKFKHDLEGGKKDVNLPIDTAPSNKKKKR